MELMRFLLRTSWPLLAIAVGTGMLSGGSSAALIAVISHALNIPKGGGGELLVWGFVALAVVALVSSIVSQVVLIRLSQEAIYRMRMQLVRQILQTELRQLEMIGSARLMASLTEDIHAITDAINRIPFLCIDIATVLGCLVYITWLSWSGLVLLIALCGLAALSCIRLIQRGQIWLRRARDEEDHLFGHFRSATEGIKELKLHSSRSSAFLREEVDVTAGSYCGYSQRGLTLFAVSTSVGKLIFFFAAGMILFALPRLLSTSGAVVSGSILTFAYLMLPMDNIVNNLPYISKSDIALQKIRSLGLSLQERSEPKEKGSKHGDGWEVLKLREVVYPYRREEEDGDFILGPISLNISKGELIFIVGGNGSGKSTLAKLLTGLYVPSSGSVELDGQVVNDANRGWYREHWSAIYSDFFLFERLLGLPEPGLDVRAKQYLKKLRLEHKVTISEGVFSTIALSQGQRKRLALLTAYLEDRPIYLFDEWAADQDPVFKEIFYKEFLGDLKKSGKTVIVISHDEHYFHLGDRLIRMENGRIEFNRPVSSEKILSF